jgi:phage FluMu protein Com
MSIEKFGANEKIVAVSKDAQAFEATRKIVANENNLIRCTSCGHLIAKRAANTFDFQHRRESMIIENPVSLTVMCPKCSGVIKIV